MSTHQLSQYVSSWCFFLVCNGMNHLKLSPHSPFSSFQLVQCMCVCVCQSSPFYAMTCQSRAGLNAQYLEEIWSFFWKLSYTYTFFCQTSFVVKGKLADRILANMLLILIASDVASSCLHTTSHHTSLPLFSHVTPSH